MEDMALKILNGLAQRKVKASYQETVDIEALRSVDFSLGESRRIGGHQSYRVAGKNFLYHQFDEAPPLLPPPLANWLNGNQDAETAKETLPLLVYIHGGGFVSGPNFLQIIMALEIATQSGYQLILVPYTKAPEGTVVQAHKEIIAVYQHLAEAYPHRPIALLGDSAGGSLVLSVTNALKEQGLRPPTRLVLISPWLDAGLTNPEIPAKEKEDSCLAAAGLREAATLFSGGLPLDDPRLSPLYSDLTGLPPTLLMIGSRDIFVCDSRLLNRRAAREKLPLIYREWKDLFHVWTAFFALLPSARESITAAAEFLSPRNPVTSPINRQRKNIFPGLALSKNR